MSNVTNNLEIDIRSSLYNATHDLHSELNNEPFLKVLLTPDLKLDDYLRIINLFFIIYNAWESSIDRFLKNHKIQFDYDSRRKSVWLKQDIESFNGFSSDQFSKPIIVQSEIESIGQLIGLLYVIEGATLGGQTISSNLYQNLQLSENNGARFFSSYGSQTLIRWKEFLTFSKTISNNTIETFAAVESARNAFIQLLKAIKSIS